MSELGLIDYIVRLEERLEQAERRLNNIFRESRITELDLQRGLAKVDALGLRSKWVPWLTQAGEVNDWSPPSIDQRVVLASVTGDPGQGFILPGGYSNAFGAPSAQGATSVRQIGSTALTMDGSSMRLEADEIVVAAGAVRFVKR